MRKWSRFVWLVVLCLLVHSLSAQVSSKVDSVVSFNLPKDATKLSKEELISYPKIRKNTRLITADSFKGLTYTFGNILFQINADSGKLENDRVERAKMAKDHLNSQITNQKYSSELMMINKNKTVVFKTEKTEYCYYEILATNETNTKVVVAWMEYKKEDETKAKKILDFFLKNLKFK